METADKGSNNWLQHFSFLVILQSKHSFVFLLLLFFQKLNRSKACADTGLLDEALIRRAMVFYTSVAEFLMHTLTGWTAGGPPPSLPLPSEIPPLFAALPEWYVEDIAEFLLFALQ